MLMFITTKEKLCICVPEPPDEEGKPQPLTISFHEEKSFGDIARFEVGRYPLAATFFAKEIIGWVRLPEGTDPTYCVYPQTFQGRSNAPMEGLSLVPAFSGGALDREAIYFEHEGNRAVLTAAWKLVARGRNGAWELYDMDNDRTEMHDLAVEQLEKLQALTTLYEAWAKRCGVQTWPLRRRCRN